MTRLVWGALAAIAAGLSAPAQAADFNYNSRPLTVQRLDANSWAGPYLGGNFGYAWGSVDNAWAKPSGFIGGVQAGYNWQQLNSPWVFGVEADIQGSSADDTFANWKFSNRWFGTVRGRGGYAFNNVLFYGTLGLALRGFFFLLSLLFLAPRPCRTIAISTLQVVIRLERHGVSLSVLLGL